MSTVITRWFKRDDDVRVLRCARVDVREERQRLHIPILVHRIVAHIHVPLPDRLALDTAEVNRLLLGVVLDDVDDGEAVDGKQMRVGAIPDCASGRRRGV